MSDIRTTAVNAIRTLSADAIQKAKSGHPGLPLGAAPTAYELWSKHMKINPENADWINRDRFILSGGHGSALYYSLLHFFGYGLTMEDMKNFRQLDSKTPGHPEFGHTVGIDATTGPLGAGMAMAVGFAMAEAHLAEKFNEPGYNVMDHYTFVLGGDGCMMEGISYEAFSLAGTLKLGKLIVIYDSNKISIEGDTEIAFTEDVKKRFEAFDFHVQEVSDGNDLDAIGAAIEAAKAEISKPSLIVVKTVIGYGCEAKQGKASAHGEPLGEENIVKMKEGFGFPTEPFAIPSEVYAHFKEITADMPKAEQEWKSLFDKYCAEFPEKKALWDKYFNTDYSKLLLENEKFWSFEDKADATRNISGTVLNRLKDIMPGLIGGSADLAPSNKTNLKDAGDYSAENYGGRNIHYGVREFSMAAIGNGLALHGGLRTFVSTFFVFSDYVKPMARLSSLMNLPLSFVFTHDSIGVGEDGPTHEPIEQLAAFRAMPNFTIIRPADAAETAAAWYYAVTNKTTPTALVLTRQNLPQLEKTGKDLLKGGYIVGDSKGEPAAIIMASGSEVSLALSAKDELMKEGIDVRVVSMPSFELFEAQSEEYKESVLPGNVRARVAVEALSDFGWGKYVGLDGAYVSMKGFGASGPADLLFKKFGFTVENVVNTVKSVLK